MRKPWRNERLVFTAEKTFITLSCNLWNQVVISKKCENLNEKPFLYWSLWRRANARNVSFILITAANLHFQLSWYNQITSLMTTGLAEQYFTLQMNTWKIIYLNCGERYDNLWYNRKSISFSTVQIYDLPSIHLHPSPSTGIYIMNSQSDQFPDGLIAQSVEHCIGIAEVMNSNPIQAWISFQALDSQLLVCITAMINHKFST